MPIVGSADLIEGFKKLDEVAEQYAAYWAYYAGDLPEAFTSQRIRALIATTAQEYRVRLAAKPVDALANRLGIASISSTSSTVASRIEELRKANDMELYEPFLHTRLCVYGDAYLAVYPVREDEDSIVQRDGERVDAAPDEDTYLAGVEFAFQSPISCRAFYDAEDGRRLRFVIRRWKDKTALGDVWRAEVWYTDRLESWVSNPGATGRDPQEWMPYAEDTEGNSYVPGDEWPEYHEFEEIPIKHARNDLPYGRSELDNFIGVQNAITKAFATQATGIESVGWRERYRIADDKLVLDQARDAVNWEDDTQATKAQKTTVSGRRSGPGIEHLYTGTKAVGEYDALDLGAFTEPMRQWVELGSIASDTPLYEFDPKSGEQMSGVARKRADIPMKNRENKAKRFLSRFWTEVYTFALALDGIDAGELEIVWQPPAVEDDPEWWATATIRRDHGVPQEQILKEANYTPEQIEEWKTEQDDALLLDGRILRLQKLGEAMQALGSGVTLLRLDEDRVATLVNAILGEAGSPGSASDLIKEPEELPEESTEDNEEEEDNAPSGR